MEDYKLWNKVYLDAAHVTISKGLNPDEYFLGIAAALFLDRKDPQSKPIEIELTHNLLEESLETNRLNIDAVQAGLGRIDSPKDTTNLLWQHDHAGIVWWPEERKVQFINGVKDISWRYIAVSLPKLFPDYFINKPLTNQEKQLIMAAYHDDADLFYEICTNITSAHDLSEYLFEHVVLDQFLNKIGKKEMQLKQNRANMLQKEINGILKNYQMRLALLENLQREIAYMNDFQYDADEYRMLLLHNQEIEIMPSASPETLTLHYKTHLDFFDPGQYETMRATQTSYLNKFDDDVKLVLDKIFSYEPEYRIKTDMIFDISSIGATGVNKADSRYHKNPNFIPNPHIYYYDCWYETKRSVAEFLGKAEYVSIIQQLLAATKTITVTDVTVMKKLVELIKDSTYHCIEDSQGNCLSFEEVLAKEKENAASHNAA